MRDPITIAPSSHRFFYQLATAQAATAAYLSGATAQILGSREKYAPNSPIHQVCLIENLEIEYQPAEILDPMVRNIWPTGIRLDFRDRGQSPIPSQDPTATQLLMGSLYEHAFITYFENNCSLMKSKHGRVKLWPTLLNFARIVRHAFAHGGLVHILDGSTVAWKGLTYSKAENGRRVLYNDLTSGDLTLLMIEMDALF